MGTEGQTEPGFPGPPPIHPSPALINARQLVRKPEGRRGQMDTENSE
jgi:hypothetical protein